MGVRQALRGWVPWQAPCTGIASAGVAVCAHVCMATSGEGLVKDGARMSMQLSSRATGPFIAWMDAAHARVWDTRSLVRFPSMGGT